MAISINIAKVACMGRHQRKKKRENKRGGMASNQ